jgi:hypothetical protein
MVVTGGLFRDNENDAQEMFPTKNEVARATIRL